MRYLYKGYDDENLRELGRLEQRPAEPTVMGHLPLWERNKGQGLSRTRRMNRYLKYQSHRIDKLIKGNNLEGAILKWMIMLKGSVSYQLVLFHRVDKQGYGKSDASYNRVSFIRCIDKIREGNLEMLLERFYIKKPNGKLRPIGAPDKCSKMISKAFNDMVVALFGTELREVHHGFMPQRGVHTAIIDIMCNYYEKGLTNIYEFDLRSGFNKVNPSGVKIKLEERSYMLANTIYQILHNTRYRGSGPLYREAELIPHGKVMKNYKGKPLIERSGLPQGSPMSPILATLALANIPTPTGLVMYADDGILMSKSLTDYQYFQSIAKVGAQIAEEKSRLVDDGRLRFLGVEIDFKNKAVIYKNLAFRYLKGDVQTSIGLMDFLKRQRIVYTTDAEQSGGYGRIDRNAYIRQHKVELAGYKKIGIAIGSLGTATSGNGYRLMSGRIIDVLAASSGCVNELATDLAHKKYKKQRPFSGVSDYADEIVDKGGYCEYLSEEEGISRLNIAILREDLATFMMN